MYTDFRDRNEVFSGVLGRFPTAMTIVWQGRSERASGDLVSGNYFDVLGVRPAIGRVLNAADDRTPGAHPVAVLSHGYWQRRFGGDPSVLDQTLVVNGHPMTIVGVAAQGFNGIQVGSASDVMVPLMMKAQMTPTWNDLDNRRSRWLTVMGRLKPGITADGAEVQLNVDLQTDQRAGDPIDGERVRDVPPALRRQAPRGPSGRARPFGHAHAVFDTARGPDVHGGRRPAHRLCERRQPPSGAVDCTAEGDRRSVGARGGPRPHRAPTPHRESPPCGRGRRRGPGAGDVDREAAAGRVAGRSHRADVDGESRWASGRVHAAAVPRHGPRLRHRPRALRNSPRRRHRAQGRSGECRRRRPAGARAPGARRRPGRAIHAASRRRGSLCAEPLQSASGRSGFPGGQPVDLLPRSIAERLQPDRARSRSSNRHRRPSARCQASAARRCRRSARSPATHG